MITFDKIDKPIQNTLLLLVFILTGLIVMIFPWMGVHTNNFNVDLLPTFLKCTISTTGTSIVLLGILSFRAIQAQPGNDQISCRITCIDDKKRNHIIAKIHPDLYLPLEENF